jgi:hypothetical protein
MTNLNFFTSPLSDSASPRYLVMLLYQDVALRVLEIIVWLKVLSWGCALSAGLQMIALTTWIVVSALSGFLLSNRAYHSLRSVWTLRVDRYLFFRGIHIAAVVMVVFAEGVRRGSEGGVSGVIAVGERVNGKVPSDFSTSVLLLSLSIIVLYLLSFWQNRKVILVL